mmetsp:Transcript_32302/g.78233  ORF Transcript_32302/g.78233 Transcript_32302/m.78233 type:complete len:208 (-) Transcript_32302:207-830(-)
MGAVAIMWIYLTERRRRPTITTTTTSPRPTSSTGASCHRASPSAWAWAVIRTSCRTCTTHPPSAWRISTRASRAWRWRNVPRAAAAIIAIMVDIIITTAAIIGSSSNNGSVCPIRTDRWEEADAARTHRPPIAGGWIPAAGGGWAPGWAPSTPPVHRLLVKAEWPSSTHPIIERSLPSRMPTSASPPPITTRDATPPPNPWESPILT